MAQTRGLPKAPVVLVHRCAFGKSVNSIGIGGFVTEDISIHRQVAVQMGIASE